MIVLTAHSGSEQTKPNSWEYLKVACDENADYVEIDVRHTKDGYLVLNHDDEYENLLISACDYSYLQKTYDILTFVEAADYILSRGKRVNADIKTIESIPKVADYILEKKVIEQVMLTGCRDKEIQYLQKDYPMLVKIYNVDELLREDSLTEDEKRAKMLKSIEDYGAVGINIPYEELTDERLRWAKENSIPTYVWTVDERDEMMKNFKREVTSITTNSLKLFHELKGSEEHAI